LIDYNLVPDNDIFNKDALEGNILGLPEVWLTGTTWEYTTDPLIWIPEEKSMEYLYSRFTDDYKKIIFTTMVNRDSTFIGIAREDMFLSQLSDEDAALLNLINNGTETLP
jgi:hypothetical protein